ncbi:MAG: ABC transporter permease [Gammaproteobacteria bacterium]|nr:ABC transporter permease [Gammaproteobacteria bacterium]
MGQYIIRRLLYLLPILLGVNIITFFLFFIVNSPDDMARIHLGSKRINAQQITQWKVTHGYDQPLFYNPKESGIKKITHTLFVAQSIKLFSFDFGLSDNGRDISSDIQQRMWPSLSIALPALILGLCLNISLALLMIFFRESYIETTGAIICIILMSISGLFYIIGLQFIFAKLFNWFPISGYQSGLLSIKFVALPVLVSIIASIGSDTRWFRTVFLEELNKDYVLVAKAKGLSASKVLFKHILKNALLPILTLVITMLPSLFLGSLLLESFFGIPGLGSYTIDAIQQQDFAIVKSMVFIGALLYITGLLLTDLAYTTADPRVKFN